MTMMNLNSLPVDESVVGEVPPEEALITVEGRKDEAVSEDNPVEYTPKQDKWGLWVVKPSRGAVPKQLTGQYTSERDVLGAIQHYKNGGAEAIERVSSAPSADVSAMKAQIALLQTTNTELTKTVEALLAKEASRVNEEESTEVADKVIEAAAEDDVEGIEVE